MFQCIMMMRLRPHIREGREGQTGIFLKCFEVPHPDEFLMFCIKVLVHFVNLAEEMQKDELVESSSDQAPDLSDKSTRIVSGKHQKHQNCLRKAPKAPSKIIPELLTSRPASEP